MRNRNFWILLLLLLAGIVLGGFLGNMAEGIPESGSSGDYLWSFY